MQRDADALERALRLAAEKVSKDQPNRLSKLGVANAKELAELAIKIAHDPKTQGFVGANDRDLLMNKEARVLISINHLKPERSTIVYCRKGKSDPVKQFGNWKASEAERLNLRHLVESKTKGYEGLQFVRKFPNLKEAFYRAVNPQGYSGPREENEKGTDSADERYDKFSGEQDKPVGRSEKAAALKHEAGRAVETDQAAPQEKRTADEVKQGRADDMGELTSTANLVQAVPQSDLDRAESAYISSPAELEALDRIKAYRAAEREANERDGDRGLGREREL